MICMFLFLCVFWCYFCMFLCVFGLGRFEKIEMEKK